MTFKTNLLLDSLDVFLDPDEFGETIVYTPSGGSPKSITAVPTQDEFTDEFDDGGKLVSRMVTIEISTDATEGIASPARKDTFTYKGLTWSVKNIGPSPSMGMATLEGENVTRETIGRGHEQEGK